MFQILPPASSSSSTFKLSLVSRVGPLSLKYQGSTEVFPEKNREKSTSVRGFNAVVVYFFYQHAESEAILQNFVKSV